MQVNPPKMERFEDVSNMTYLNEAAVLWNLKSRYVAKLIYVSTKILRTKRGKRERFMLCIFWALVPPFHLFQFWES